MLHAGLCPVCREGVRGFRRCHDHAVCVCDECEATWTHPRQLEVYVYPRQPESACPVCDRSLWGPQTRWADADDLARIDWSDLVKGELPSAAAQADQPLTLAIVGGELAIDDEAVSGAAKSVATEDGGAETAEIPADAADSSEPTDTEETEANANDADKLTEFQSTRGVEWARHVSDHEAFTLAGLPALSDAVLLATPPSQRLSHLADALASREHVLAAPPWGRTPAESQELAAAAAEANTVLMSLLPWWWLPRTAEMALLARGTALGAVHRITIAHSSVIADCDAVQLLWPTVVAAVLFSRQLRPDVGVSTAELERFDREAEVASLVRDRAGGFVATLRLGETVATLDISPSMPRRQWIEIAGEFGSLVCDDLFIPPREKPARFWIHAGKNDEARTFEPISPEAAQLTAFRRAIDERRKAEETAIPLAHRLYDDVCLALEQTPASASK